VKQADRKLGLRWCL